MNQVTAIGQYGPLVELGVGRIATVYGAITEDDRSVAVKVFRDAEAVAKRFGEEIDVLQELATHPEIVPILDHGVTDAGEPFLVMPMRAGSLQQLVEQQGPLDWTDVVSAIWSVARAVQYGHDRGISHCAIRPSNVLLDTAGHASIADFGLANLVGSEAESFTDYTAPERINGAAPSRESDVYSLGASAIALIMGEAPPAAFDPDEVEADLAEFDVPEGVATALAQSVATDPADRPSTADAFAALLRSEADLVAVDVSDAPSFPLPEAVDHGASADGPDGSSERVRPRRVWLALAGLLSIIGIGYLVLEFTTSTPEPEAAPVVTLTPATAVPTATPIPDQRLGQLITDVASAAGLVDTVAPASGCIAPSAIDHPIWFSCLAGRVQSAADGRVVLVSRHDAVETAPIAAAPWTWTRGLSLGNFVVVDHGRTDTAGSVISVYSGLATIDDSITTGLSIGAGQTLGTIAADGAGEAGFGWELWADDLLPGQAPKAQSPSAAVSIVHAAALSEEMVVPAPSCTFPAGDPNGLPNSARAYRSGVHQGIDFGCGAVDQDAVAAAAGRVVMVVDDFVEPTPPDRLAILASAAAAGDTPDWILTSLYGTFVVLEHDQFSDFGPVYTIYAHLTSVDPAIALGDLVAPGTRIGEIGVSGTSSATRPSLEESPEGIHLHWEIIIGEHYLAEDLSGAATDEVYRQLLCNGTFAIGCT